MNNTNLEHVNGIDPLSELAAAIAVIARALAGGQKAASPPPTLLTVDEAANRLACSRSFLYMQIKSGEISGVKIGRRRFISTAELDEYIKRCAA